MWQLKPGSVSKANELAKRLTEIASLSKGKNKKRTASPRIEKGDARFPSTRADIVSESLCDDVIKYLAPTLQQHKGCTLIDIHPGACLFSSKLHEFLKPKVHLLLESEDSYYEPFIKPLLDKADSTYRYSQLKIAHAGSYWTEIRRVQQDQALMPSRPALSVDDPRRRQLDPSLLVIGNLVRHRTKTSSYSVAQAQLMLHILGNQALSNEYLYQAGLVRMLLWVPEIYKTSLLAAVPWYRTGFSLGLDMGLNITEAVSVQSLDSLFRSRMTKKRARHGRSHVLDHLNIEDVRERMRTAGMSPPKDRPFQALSAKSLSAVQSIVPLSPLIPNASSVAELEDKIKIAASLIAGLYKVSRLATQFQNSSPMIIAALNTIEYPQVPLVLDEYLSESTLDIKKDRLVVLLDLALRVINIEASFSELEEKSDDSKTMEDARTRILALSEDYTNLLGSLSESTENVVRRLIDDQMVFHASPQNLTLYRRSYEPLKASAEEFWPAQDLGLLDLMPKERDLAVPDLANGEEATKFCVELLRTLFSAPKSSLPKGLDQIGVNAAKDLIPMVPAITDARRGGRLNPHHLRVTLVTEEMIEGLVKAFFEWPFRPQSWEVAAARGDVKGLDRPVEGEAGTGSKTADLQT